MDRKKLSDHTKGVIIGLGAGVICLALIYLPKQSFSWGYVLVLAFSVLITPRTSLTLPHSKLTFSFSEAIIFLTFLMYGGELAILTAFVESVANCRYLKNKGTLKGRWMILFNSSAVSIVTAVSYGVLLLYIWTIGSEVNLSDTRSLVTVLGLLSLAQFFGSSIFTAVYQNIKTGDSIWEIWKNQCLSSSLTQFTGVCMTGIIYKLINYADFLVIGIAAVGLVLIYLSYRQSIGDMGNAILAAEAAEREKAEAERERRREAERHSSQLAATLEKEEKANEALRKSEQDLQYAALYDSLTALPNRKHFGDILRKLIHKYKDDPSVTFQVLFLDISKFKNINDSLGHTLGDKVLMVAAKRFVRMLNSTDMVARIGGDEFAIILKNLSTVGKAQKVARRIRDSISQPFSLSGNRISISVNIGIAPCDAEYTTPEEVLRDADIAMHYAKEKNTGAAVFTKELRVRFLERITLENDLRNAIDRDELSMSYQPLIDIQDGSLFGFEALLRWHHSEFGNIPPNKFIPMAEESGLIIPITVWILRQTTNQLAQWQKISPAHKDLIVSVNISGKHLSNDDLIDDVETALAVSKISPSSLKLEITESAAMENAEHTINMLNRLKLLGVQLSIDDFGTGYSSLSYLHRLPFDTLKIDRSFVYSVGESGENSEILQTIISLAKNLKKKVIAEGIETEAQLTLLRNLGCDYGQGYLLAKPLTKDKAEQALYERKRWLPADITNGIEDTAAHVQIEENLPVF
ncbi:MAG: bifunctional diguanylate cyclase/phosphodiesterase [Pyrinomonadaceae bacterium]